MQGTFISVAVVGLALVTAPVAYVEKHKAAYACSALAIDPSTAINLVRPAALRYKSAPLRICIPDDTNGFRKFAKA